MKKFALFLLSVGLFCCLKVDAQEITVADGTDQMCYFPISTYHWLYSGHSQSIYPASMLTEMQGKYVTTLTWYMTSAPSVPWIDTQTVRVGITNAANLTNGLISATTSVVWTGRLSAFVENDLLRIPLDAPFQYNGGNLIVEIVKGASNDSYNGDFFYGQNQSTIMSVNQVGSYNPPYTGEFLPKLTFTCQDEPCSNPEFLESSGITYESAILSWKPGRLGTASEYRVAYRSDSEAEYTEVLANDTFLMVSGLHPITSYRWKVQAVCSDTLSSEWSLERSFTTQRRLASIPYHCDFEDSTENVNWNLPANPDAVNNRWHVGTYVSYNGTRSLYVSSNNGATNLIYGFGTNYVAWAYRDFKIDTLYPQYNITFRYLGYEGHTAFFGPQVNSLFSGATPIHHPAGCTRLSDNQSLPEDSVWMEQSYSFSVDTPGVYRLYFDWYTAFNANSGKPAATIDDISIVGVPCLQAHTLESTDITDTSATLSWQYNCVGSPMGYMVGYKTAADSSYTEITVYDTNALTLTGLTPHTTYYWRVKTLYDHSFASDWSSEYTFQTDLIWVHPLPYTCDFEDATENMAWNVPVFSGNNKDRWYIGHNTYSSANTSLYATTMANGSNNIYNSLSETMLWTYRDLYFDPQYDSYELSFDAKVKGNPGYAFAQVFVGDPVEPSDSLASQSTVWFESTIEPTIRDNAAVWKNLEYNLDHTFSGHRRLFFLWQIHSNNYRFDPAIAIDNIVVTGTHCPRPLHLATEVADTLAHLSWQRPSQGMSESFTVAYKAASASSYTLVETSDTTLTLTDLQPYTSYTWKVRSNCSDTEHSEWTHEEVFMTYRRLSTMPYTCDFEDPSVNALWCMYARWSSPVWCIGTAVQHNGQYACYISNDHGETYQTTDESTNNAYMYQDFLFDTTYSEYVLEFNLKTFDISEQRDLAVYVVSPASPSSFATPASSDLVGQFTFNDTLWHTVRIVVDQTHSGIQRLVFEWAKEYYYTPKGSCAVDEITFKGSVVGRPYALTASNVKHNSALLTWEANNRHAPASYQLAYRKAGDTTYTVLTLTDTVYLASMLTPNTIYYWKARTRATNDELSDWSDEVTFCTAGCTPYHTGFEDEVDLLGWNVASVSYELDKWVIGRAVSYDSISSLYISNDYGATNTSLTEYVNDIISVYRDIYIAPGATEYQITFDYLGMGADIQLQSLDVPASPAVSVATIPTSDNWQRHRIAIDSSFTGFYRLFIKRGYGKILNKAGAVDNLAVEASECPPPAMLATTLMTPTSAQIAWSRIGEPPYQVAYKIQSDHDYVEVEVQDTTFLISNMQADTSYFWKVRGRCGNAYGDWSSDYSFYTTPLLPYFCDFEDVGDVAHWVYEVPYGVSYFDDPARWNYWAINEAAGDNGNTSLHVSSALGEGSYHPNVTTCLWAYRDFCLSGSATNYQISFDYKGLGQVGQDFARVYLGPPATPPGLAAPDNVEQISGDLCMVPVWTHYSFEVDSTHAGLQRLYFQWRCNDMIGANPGAAFDNISVQVSDCAIPKDPATVSVTATTATLSWSPGNAGALPMNYTVAYRLMSDSVFTEVSCNDTTLQLTELLPDKFYYWVVRANCSATDHSLWSNSVCFATTQPSCAAVPYECGFEDAGENASWSHYHLRGDNEWVVGSATFLDGDSALYVSSDGGATNSFTINTSTIEWVYRDLYFNPGNEVYEISFDFKGKGTNSHYASVFLGKPEVMYENFTPENAESLGGKLYNITDWQHFSFLVDSTHSGVQRLYILWNNSTYTLSQPPAAIDNIVVSASPCREPIDLMSEATADEAILSWTIRLGGTGEDYTVAYRPQDDSTYTFINVSDTFLILQHLDSNTNYYWKVRHNCDDSCSIWSEGRMFYTHNQIVYFCDFDSQESISSWVILNERANSHWYSGCHNQSLPNGTFYVSSDGGESNIYDTDVASNLWAYTDVYIKPGGSSHYLSFDFKGMGEPDNDYMNVYVGSPAQPSVSEVPAGTVAMQNIGMRDNWTHYNLVIDSIHTGVQRIYFLWSTNNAGGTNPPASIDNLCLSRELLSLPDEITAIPSATEANIAWSFSGPEPPVSYNLSYAALSLDSSMTEITIQHASCDLSNLLPNTDYLCKVRANYADGSYSLWRMTQFRTLTDTTHPEDSVNVADYQLEHEVLLYPNPSTQYVDVLSKNKLTILYIEIYDTYGKFLLRSNGTVNPKRVNVSELTSGVYLMRVITDHGAVTKPFIKR